MITVALLHKFVYEFRGNNTYIILDRTALVGTYMIVHFFSIQFYVELYELEASQNIKLKQPLYEKRRKVINDKDSHGGESGIDGFWLQVSFYFL